MWRKQKAMGMEVVSNRKALMKGLGDPEGITWNKLNNYKKKIFFFVGVHKFVKCLREVEI